VSTRRCVQSLVVIRCLVEAALICGGIEKLLCSFVNGGRVVCSDHVDAGLLVYF